MKWLTDIRRYALYWALLKRFALPVWVLYMLDHGLSLEQVATIGVLAGVIQIVFEVPSGAISDTLGHKRALMLAAAGESISMLFFLGGTFEWIMLGSLLFWASGTLITGTADALLYDRLKEDGREHEYQKVYGAVQGFAHGVGIASMLLAGFVYMIHPTIPFMVGCVQFALSGWMISGFNEAKCEVSVENKEGYAKLIWQFPNAFKQIWKSQRLFWLIAIDAVAVGTLYGILEFEQVLLTNVGLLAGAIGTVFAVKRVMAVMISPYTHYISARLRAPIVLSISGILFSTGFIFLYVFPSVWMVIGVLLVLTSLGNAFNVMKSDYANREIIHGSRATALSMQNFALTAVKILTVGSIGWFTSLLSLEQTVLYLGIVSLVITMYISVNLFRVYRA